PFPEFERWHRPPAEPAAKRGHGWVIDTKKPGCGFVKEMQREAQAEQNPRAAQRAILRNGIRQAAPLSPRRLERTRRKVRGLPNPATGINETQPSKLATLKRLRKNLRYPFQRPVDFIATDNQRRRDPDH